MKTVLKEKKYCCGCGACACICPHGAIEMKPDDEGFLYPEINEETCTDCALCRRACPCISLATAAHPYSECYAAWHNDREVLEKSSSGGIFTAISDLVLDSGGVVYGCAHTEEIKAVHARAESRPARDRFCGSKYVQSEIGTCYLQVRDDLRNGRKVLFTGTPCQVAGLYSFLSCVSADGLLTASVICHGVPSPLLFREYLAYSAKRRKAKIIEYQHRPKHNHWAHVERSSFVYDNGDSDSDSLLSQAWKQLFYSSAALRPCCYECPWATGGHPSDITIGDFWGIEDAYPEFYNKMGVSAVLLNTDKGRAAFEQVKPNLTMRPVRLHDITPRNPNLQKPPVSFVNRDSFWKMYKKRGFDALVWKYGHVNYYWSVRRFIKKTIKALCIWR